MVKVITHTNIPYIHINYILTYINRYVYKQIDYYLHNNIRTIKQIYSVMLQEYIREQCDSSRRSDFDFTLSAIECNMISNDGGIGYDYYYYYFK